MIIGISFHTYEKIKVVLKTVLSLLPDNCKYFDVAGYWILSFGNGLNEQVYTLKDIRNAIENLTDNESAESFDIFAATDKEIFNGKHPETMVKYLAMDYLLAFCCYDGCNFELYLKDEKKILSIAKTLKNSMICQGTIVYIDQKTNQRKLFCT